MNLVILLTSPISHTSIFMVLCFWTWWKAKTPDDRRRADWFMIAASVSLFTNWVSLAAARSMGSYSPVKLDAYAFWADRFLGNPSFFIGRLVHGSPALLQLSMTGYDLLPAAVFAAFALTIWFRPRDSSRVGVALLLSIASLPICYCLLPACGPGYAFKSFPQLPSGPVPLAG